jgi:putative two-component system response regulator
MRVLIVEDNAVDAELLTGALCAFGYTVEVARNGDEAFDFVRTGRYRLVISDWEMPGMKGPELCRKIRERADRYVYIILLTMRSDTRSVVEGLNAGADDFLTKPFQPDELCVRVRAGERILTVSSRDVTIFSLAKLAESRDPETGAHLERMREYCRIIVEDLAEQSEFRDVVDGEFVQTIYLTSPLHDIGKVGVPDRILLKPGKLTAEEFEIMKQHTVVGGQTLDAALQAYPEAKYLQMARDIAWSHHEKFDGSGYPRGLAGDAIPLCGRIAALADVYDALTTKRVYKEAFSHQIAREIILDGSGKHFDPQIVDAFRRTEQEFIDVHDAFDDSESHPFFQQYRESALAEA